jgi:hypothetical protein
MRFDVLLEHPEELLRAQAMHHPLRQACSDFASWAGVTRLSVTKSNQQCTFLLNFC